MKKTVREHLEDLPEPVRSEALAQMWWEDANNMYELQSRALQQAFSWHQSPQGKQYWFNIYLDLMKKECPLPL